MAKDQGVKVVAATGISSSATLSGNTDLADRVQSAMEQAIRECLDAGIVDPDEQRERMLAARDAVLSE